MDEPVVKASYYFLEGPLPSTSGDTLDVIKVPGASLVLEEYSRELTSLSVSFGSSAMVETQPSKKPLKPTVEGFNILAAAIGFGGWNP